MRCFVPVAINLYRSYNHDGIYKHILLKLLSLVLILFLYFLSKFNLKKNPFLSQILLVTISRRVILNIELNFSIQSKKALYLTEDTFTSKLLEDW